jgi:hypothetical protein
MLSRRYFTASALASRRSTRVCGRSTLVRACWAGSLSGRAEWTCDRSVPFGDWARAVPAYSAAESYPRFRLRRSLGRVPQRRREDFHCYRCPRSTSTPMSPALPCSDGLRERARGLRCQQKTAVEGPQRTLGRRS